MKTLNRNILRALLAAGLMLAGNVVMMGSTYYARVTINVASPTGGGTVYISKDSQKLPSVNFEDKNGNGDVINFNVNAYLKAEANLGYHFDKWTIGDNVISTSKDYNYQDVIPVTPKEEEYETKTIDITGNFAENFYAELSLETSPGTSGTPTCEGSGQSESAGGDVVFNITAPDADDGYHFTRWTGDETLVDISQPDSKNTDVIVSASKKGGPDNKETYTATANYAQNIYYATLSATPTPSAGGSASVTKSPLSTETKGGDVIFEINADPAEGYHFVNWTTTGDGKIENPSSPSTTFTASASSKYDKANAIAYTVTAHFAVDKYYAKLTSAVSSLSEGTGHTVFVSTDGINWDVDNKEVGVSTANRDVTFYVKAVAAAGYKFIGWSESDDSETTVTIGADGKYIVKSSGTEGGTNAKTLYAIFKKEYSITINANSSATDPKGKIVFKIVSKSDGGKKYRVSVPVGGSITLKDVGEGGYTITPETIWHWSYKVEPASDETDYDANNLSTNTFTVMPKSTTKKHAEVGKTVTTPGA